MEVMTESGNRLSPSEWKENLPENRKKEPNDCEKQKLEPEELVDEDSNQGGDVRFEKYRF